MLNLKTVWLVELRDTVLPDTMFDCTHMHTASSREKAIAWCENYIKAERKEPNEPWWFFVSEETIDEESVLSTRNGFILDWNGNEIGHQPYMGYDVEYRSHEQDCELCNDRK